MKPNSPPEPLPQDQPHTVKVIHLKRVDQTTLKAMAVRYRVSNLLHFVEGILAALDKEDERTGTELIFRDRAEGIEINQLGPESIGKWVEYRGGAGMVARGRIKSWNDRVVFVVYRCAGEWSQFKDFTAAATDPADLTFC
jgi:hypothetical protein